MSQGVIILIVMVVFFIGMAIFAFKFSNIKEKREARKRLKRIQEAKLKDKKIKEEHSSVRELIAEKYRLDAERSQVIQKELRRVAEYKQKIDDRFN